MILHLSHIKNRINILKHGVIPTKPKFQFQRDILGDSVSFWWLDCDRNYKYIKDLIYIKDWLHPRNEFIERVGGGIKFMIFLLKIIGINLFADHRMYMIFG